MVAVAIAAGVASSERARTSLRAAYIAFRDPSRVRDPHEDGSIDESRTAPSIEQPELGADFGRGDETDLGDAGLAGVGGLASLVLPEIRIPLGPRTEHFIAYFAATAKGREGFSVRYRRAGRYRRFIEQALRDADLPEDLLWLCAIESSFEPQATSPKGAAGVFQLMPETASRYGLVQTEVMDERRSIPRSTAVAITLLRDLFDVYGEWDLTLAAYHLGRDRLDEAITRLRDRRGPRDAHKPITLQDLVEARLVPKETANFVPQVHAFAIVAANRGRFGLDDLDPAPALDFAEIAVPESTPLRVVAKAAGVSISVIRDYNPGLLRDRTPEGNGDTLVSVPADRVATALASFPAVYAREMSRLADAGASSAVASAKAAPGATATAGSVPAPPPSADSPAPRITLPSGIVIEQRARAGGDVELGARVELVPRRSSAAVFTVPPIVVAPNELGAAADRIARAVRALVVDGGDAAAAARRRAGDERRQRLARAPYGLSWLAVGDRLFPPQSPLAGLVLTTPAMPLTSVAIADPPAPIQSSLAITVTLGGADARASAGLLDHAFAGVLEASTAPIEPYPREDRVELTETVPAVRVVFAWLTPSAAEAGRAALRLAMLAIAHNEVGKVARVLVGERRVAVHVRGFLDLGERASVPALEIVPAVPHSASEVQAELDAALAAFAEQGPTAAELVAVKALHRARVQAERSRAGLGVEPKEAALARLTRLSAEADAVTASELRDLVKRVFSPGHRVLVVTRPRG